MKFPHCAFFGGSSSHFTKLPLFYRFGGPYYQSPLWLRKKLPPDPFFSNLTTMLKRTLVDYLKVFLMLEGKKGASRTLTYHYAPETFKM